MEKKHAHAQVMIRRGAWTQDEDTLLRNCILQFGEGKWHKVPSRAGLNRCRKSCRLRWLNYLRPNLKRGYFTKDEVDLITRLHKLLGNRWSLIAGRVPGRTANDIKNFWNTHMLKKSKRTISCNHNQQDVEMKSTIIKPCARHIKPTAQVQVQVPVPVSKDHKMEVPLMCLSEQHVDEYMRWLLDDELVST